MSARFVTPSIHAMLDYPVALTLMAAPFALELGSSHPFALWLSVATGVAAFVLTLFTNHRWGLFRVVPFSIHLGVDFAVGVIFLVAPFALGFRGLDMWFYLVNGVAVLSVVGLHKPEPTTNNLRESASFAA